jgi:polyisoprenyl-phosphate glycosyltransferase
MTELSLIIPCYNEEKNIKRLFYQVSKLEKKINLEFIIVNNGSKDETKKKILIFKKNIKKIKIVNIRNNIGFGNGIKMGIKKATADIICYTHGDLQINLTNVQKAFKIYELKKNKNILIKGSRFNRSFFNNFFTISMSFLNTLIFRKYLPDIHAQPNLFKKKMIKNINFLPDGMILDLYIFLCARIKNYEVVRFKVKFLDRKHGIGSNETVLRKVKYSLLSIFSSLMIFFNGRF